MRASIFFVAAAALAAEPYTFTICASRAPVRVCPDGLTFTVSAPPAALRRLAELAPSQYQANWRRSGGVIDGGSAVELLLDILADVGGRYARFLDGFAGAPDELATLPPLPIDFVSSLAISAGQHRLPSFSYPLDEIARLEEYETPVWQIFHAPWRRHALSEAGFDSAELVLRSICERISELYPAAAAASSLDCGAGLVGLRLTGLDADVGNDHRWEAVTGEPVDLADVPLKLERVAKVDGLAATVHHKITIPEGFENCALALDQLLPRGVTLTCTEPKISSSSSDLQLIMPHFLEIELPKHQATGSVYRVAATRANRTVVEFDIRYGLRMVIGFTGEESGDSELQPPAVSLQCPGRNRQLGHFVEIVNKPESGFDEKSLLLKVAVIPLAPLPLVAAATAAAILAAIGWLIYQLLPLISLQQHAKTE